MERIRLQELFGSRRPLIGMVHLPPLPGAPGYHMPVTAIGEHAVREANLLCAAGFDAVLVENFGDAPFFGRRVPPQTLAALAVVTADVVRSVACPVGINVLRNDARAALAVCAAAGARFFRVNVHVGAMLTDQGWIEGDAARTVRVRQRLVPGAALLADVHVKHAAPPHGWTLEQAAQDTWRRGRADALVVSGTATGAATEVARVAAVRRAVPEAVILIGSGLDPENAAALLAVADGAIVGSAVQHDGRAGHGVDPERARALVAAARACD